MKTFANYLTESSKTYNYRIKFVGDIDNNFFKNFKDQLKKFDPKSVGEIKKTPVQAQLRDFPNFANQSVSMMDVELNYPVNDEQVQQIAELLGLDADRVGMATQAYADSLDTEALGIANQNVDLLNSDYPETNKEQKQLSDDYANGNQQVVKNSAEEANWTVAGGKTPAAQTTNELPMGVKSPMTDMQRPPLPATGNHPKGQ